MASAQPYFIPESSGSSSDVVSQPPPLPTRHSAPIQPSLYSVSDTVSAISIVRQHEAYQSPQMNEVSELFSIASFDSLKAKLDAYKTNHPDSDLFWYKFLEDYNNQLFHKEGVEELEQHIIAGIPVELRALVYYQVLQIRYKFNNKDNFETLLGKAKLSTANKNQDAYIERLPVDSTLKDVLKVFNYYINDISSKSARIDTINNEAAAETHEDKVLPNSFVIHVSQLLETIPDLENDELLFILLKFNKLFVNLIKDEFFYKINRSLEEIVPEAFKHITLQGINLNVLYKKILFTYFEGKIQDNEALLKTLDLFVFEGFDFLLRLVVWVFEHNQTKVQELEGDELNDYLNSEELFNIRFDWVNILTLKPSIIKFENEYHLIHANSLNNNNNELRNLKEINDDLNMRINEITQQLDDLQTTHTEIFEQSEEFKGQLNQALEKQQQKNDLRGELQEKYEHLTMKENLKNTIKANKEFSDRNIELELQIELLRKKIEDKKVKLGYETK